MILKSGGLALIGAVLVPILLLGEDNQTRGEAMLERARAASDIRAPNASPFRLKVDFSFVSDAMETVQGTYTEWWVSKNQWRRETAAGDSSHIEIGGADKRWLLDTGTGLPEQVRQLPALLNIVPPKSEKLQFDSILDPAPGDLKAECSITVPGPGKQKSAYCFHKPSGVLIQKIEPFPVGRRIAGYSCNYAAFQMFGNHTYPHEMACFVEGHRKIEAKVAELSLEPLPNSVLFNAPPDAIEVDSCPGKMQLPKLVSDPVPPVPLGVRGDSSVVVELVVDAKGYPRNVRVARSGGKSFDDHALRSVRTWRFEPATCDGRPMAMINTVQVTFRPSR